MTKSVVRLSLMGMLLGAIVPPALAHHGNPVLRQKAPTEQAIKASGLPNVVADGNPIPWPTTTKPPATGANLPNLVADGNPIPWPTTTRPPATGANLPNLVADGNPIPWPTTTKPPATAVFVF